MGTIARMGAEGDTKLIWSEDNADEVEAAEALFDDLVAKGFTAFAVREADGKRGTRLSGFDPAAEKIILVPQVAGGR